MLYICRPPLLLQCSQYKMLLELFVFYVVCLQTALIGDQCILCCMFADHPDGSQCILCCVLADHLDQRPVYFVLCICRPPWWETTIICKLSVAAAVGVSGWLDMGAMWSSVWLFQTQDFAGVRQLQNKHSVCWGELHFQKKARKKKPDLTAGSWS